MRSKGEVVLWLAQTSLGSLVSVLVLDLARLVEEGTAQYLRACSARQRKVTVEAVGADLGGGKPT